MGSFLRRNWPPAAMLAAAALPCVLAYLVARGRMVMVPPAVHFVVVTAAGALAALAAVAMSVVAARRHDGRAVVIGFGFSVMAVLLVVHGLATPGLLLGDNSLVALAGGLNLPAGAAVLGASALPALRRPARADLMLVVHVGVVVALATAAAFALLDPSALPAPPPAGSAGAVALMLFGIAACGVLAWRAARTQRLTRRIGDLAVAVGAVLLGGAVYGLLTLGMMDAGWWVAHALEVTGIGLVGIPAALDLRAGGASRPLVGDLAAGELVADEEFFLGARVHALMIRLAEKDPSTEVHTRSVAALAVRIGERLGLPAGRLRLLALGGLLHDMGKLAVPDRILRKPGALTDEEFGVIRGHPVWGRELLNELGGFPSLVLDLVEGHHERIDGTGYPNRTPAAELALEVRVLAVADVYDALTADRVYRAAWPSERALALLEEETGSAFDPACVAALKDVIGAVTDGEVPAWRLGLADAAPPPPPSNVNGALKADPA
jgi:HD-GYP domain-containing protein (c-di-GMP phosphodiesterase class II)